MRLDADLVAEFCLLAVIQGFRLRVFSWFCTSFDEFLSRLVSNVVESRGFLEPSKAKLLVRGLATLVNCLLGSSIFRSLFINYLELDS